MSSVVTWPWLTAMGVAVAIFVALIQERKLSFDLFARRFDAYDDVNKAINARLSESQILTSFIPLRTIR